MICQGFVVNVHDPLNYDIDLTLNESQSKKYNHVIANNYTYIDYSEDKLEPVDIERTSTIYRCRLKGVGIVDSVMKNDMILKNIYVDICRIFDEVEGWVSCTVNEIDSYSRILVDINYLDRNKERNLLDLFFCEKYSSAFYHYK
jgi:hypothetical protein